MEPNESVEQAMNHPQKRKGATIPVGEAVINFLIDCYRDLERSTFSESEREDRMSFLNHITGDIGNILILPKSEAAKLLEAFYARVRTALIIELLSFIDPITDDVQPQKFVGLGDFPEGHTINFNLDWKMAFLLSLAGHLHWEFGIDL